MRYRYRLEDRREKKLGFIKLIRRLAILALVAIALYTLFLFVSGRPQLSEDSLKSLSLIPREKTFRLSFTKPIRELKIIAQQDGQKKEIYSLTLPGPSKEISFTLNAQKAGLKDGSVMLLLEASSGFLQKKSYRIEATVDTHPPVVNVLSYSPSVLLGGTGAIKVKLNEEGSVYVDLGGFRYSLYPLGEGYYFGLFPVRLDQQELKGFAVVATDRAGNSSSQPLSLKVRVPAFKKDIISIDDDFINRVIYPLLGDEGKGLEPVEAFKKVNEELRSVYTGKLEQIGAKSEPRILWEDAFMQLPNSRVLATYGDIRHYYYRGQKISESRHMGFDFASVEKALVPASNSGVVVFTGSLGIYGNTVIIDHGMGLMSLYGHLSEIHVKEGQFVKKGQPVGRTGATGLALGDHLHFGVLVHGYEVNPVEWLDGKWIRNQILSVLEAR